MYILETDNALGMLKDQEEVTLNDAIEESFELDPTTTNVKVYKLEGTYKKKQSFEKVEDK
jgi:hypothetical protein